MTIKTFSVGCSRTVNLGNYESIRIEASIVWELPDTTTNGDYIAAKEMAQNELRALLEQTYKAQYTKPKAERF